jgi:hypothetical protein
MQKGLISKGLVFSVIVLFISVSIQPVLADTPIITSKDVDGDCIECQVSDGYNHLRINLLLTRLKTIVNFISFKDEDIPEVKDISQDIIDIVNSNKLLNPPIIECLSLLTQIVTAYSLFIYSLMIAESIYPIFPSLALKIEEFAYINLWKFQTLIIEYGDLNCEEIWGNPFLLNGIIGDR